MHLTLTRFPITELFYAITVLKHHTVTIHECYFYTTFSPIFRDYYKLLASLKCKYDDFSDTPSEDLPQRLRKLNEDMGFTEPQLAVTPETINSNKSMRASIKMIQNATLVRSVCILSKV